ncbi:GTP pyrophosphokinase [Nocardia wallacei]|uniref:GTP pyrophosphokinase n=1 Tax=Nocardia wallacei TaxID=480035 RepID=UPI002453CE2E|nr:RelA/SpoT domain-containing protein [Nocardia wallacei]
MDIIDEFIIQYVREFDYYTRVAKFVEGRLDEALHSAGIKCIVTSRAKSVDRLRDKCIKRNKKREYPSTEAIRADIRDLAGVRVALYFPGQRDEVDRIISRLFNLIGERREFPQIGKIDESSEGGSSRNKNRFSGYSALHYLLRIKDEDLSAADTRYSSAQVEVQVASVLMHGWSEVEHDLAYKPLQGDLSAEEVKLLDQLNGLVHAGEIALEQLQQAGQKRVEESTRPFASHFELAGYLLNHAREIGIDTVSETELGQVDVLHRFAKRLGITTPGELKIYLAHVHERVEQRALAEQVIDAILREDPNRIETLIEVFAPYKAGDKDAMLGKIGEFVLAWSRLEQYLDRLAPGSKSPIKALMMLETNRRVDPILLSEIHNLRRLRNQIVHSRIDLNLDSISNELDRLNAVIERVRELLDGTDGSGAH